MKTVIRDATYAECAFVSRRLRPEDADEIMPLLAVSTPEELATLSVTTRYRWVATAEDGEPVAILGWAITRPFFAQVFFYATPRWPEVAEHVSRFAAREMKNAMAASEIYRAECWALAEHFDSRRWLEWLGFKQFGVAGDMGPRRATYIGYCFTRTMLEIEMRELKGDAKGNGHAKGREPAHEKRPALAARQADQ